MKFGLAMLAAALASGTTIVRADSDDVPPFAQLLAHPVKLKPELTGKHPRVFVTAAGLEALRARARGSHKDEWQRTLAAVTAVRAPAPAAPGPQARRAQNTLALALAEAAFTWAVERDTRLLAAARQHLLAVIDYEPWGYASNKPNVDLAAGHLLYAVALAYDLLFDELRPDERARVRASLERHARLVAEHFAPRAKRRFAFTQNHDFIPMAGLGIAALALLGESADAPAWAALARAHQHRAAQLLAPDGFYYEGIEYFIFSAPWLMKFVDAWEHTTGESLWELGPYRNWKRYLAHTVLPDGQTVFDFGDAWEGPVTRARAGDDYARAYPGGTLQSNFNILYRVAARLGDAQTQAVAERLRAFGHSNQEDFWTLLWHDPAQKAAPMSDLPLAHHFGDSGVVCFRSSWDVTATAFAFKAGPPQGHRLARLLPLAPEAKLSSGHAHPDAGSFIVYAGGRTVIGDTGYSGHPSSRHENTITVAGIGQGDEKEHDVWRDVPYATLDGVRISEATLDPRAVKVVADLAAAYPEAAGLRRFRRTFSFAAPATFTISDDIETTAARPVQWRLHGDLPFTLGKARFTIAAPGHTAPVLAGSVRSPATADLSTAAALVLAPGPPGSIENGVEVARGHEVVITSKAAVRHRFDVTLKLTGSAR